MTTDETAQVLAEIERKRGYILDFHKVLAAADPVFLRAYEGLISAAYTDERLLSRREKELLYIGVLMALGGERSHIRAHMEVARRLGVTREEILETLESCLPACGVPKFMNAFDAWREAFPEAEKAEERRLRT